MGPRVSPLWPSGLAPPSLAPSPIDSDILRIPVGPGSLHVDRYGHGGTPVVLLHGFGTSSFLWRWAGPELARAQRMAFAIDLLGHGESDRPFDADYGIAAQAEYLDRALTALRISSAVIVGVDLGGGVALRLAATRPERVSGLVLVNSIAFDCFPGRDIKLVQRNTARFAVRISRDVLGAAPLITPLLQGSVVDPANMPPKLIARYLAPFVGREGVGHLLSLARAIRTEELEELDLTTVQAPTLVVWGDGDHWLDDNVADDLAATLPNSRLIRMPDVGRLVPEEAPEEFAALLLEFTEGREPAAPALV